MDQFLLFHVESKRKNCCKVWLQRTRCNEATEILTSYFIHVTSKKIEDSSYMKTIKSTEFLYEVSVEKAELGYKIHDIEVVLRYSCIEEYISKDFIVVDVGSHLYHLSIEAIQIEPVENLEEVSSKVKYVLSEQEEPIEWLEKISIHKQLKMGEGDDFTIIEYEKKTLNLNGLYIPLLDECCAI